MKKSIRRRIGDFVEIDLGDGKFAYGRVLEDPVFGFYDLLASTTPPLSDILVMPIKFKIFVMKNAISSGRWRVIGNKPLEPELAARVKFFNVDSLSKEISIYDYDHEVPATFDKCQGMECAAVWSAEHVEDRLRDEFAGVKNKWVESLSLGNLLKPKDSKIGA
ncbi:MAG: hypothetical protein RL748_621 [Pseudomonadota bacterium]